MIHLSVLKKISIAIVSLHFAVFIWAFFIPIEPNKKKHEPLVVRSIIEEPKITPATKKAPTKTAPSPIKSKKIEQAPIKKVAATKPKEVKKITRSVGKSSSSSSDALFVPTLSSEPIKVPPKGKTEKISFEEILQFLESMIILPIKSAIKAKITIQPDGKIREVIVLQGDMENKNYLIQTLEGYLLPIDTTCQHERELIINFRGL